MRRITLNDIAKELNTTAATVSRALNDEPRISHQTKKLVLDTARRMGYERNNIASSLRSGKSSIVGVIVPFADRSFFSSIIRGIEEVVNKAGYNVMICQSHDRYEDEVRCIETLQKSQVASIMLSISKEVDNYDHIRKLMDGGTPTILFDNITESLNACLIGVDDYKGAYEAVDHLINQGYRRIAHFLVNKHIGIYQERFRGYKDALFKHGLRFDENLVFEVNSEVEAGRAVAGSLLDSNADALFSSSDFAALGAMQYLKLRGVRIPQDFGIVGFSNEPFTCYIDPSLSTVDQKSKEMGEVVGHSFLDTLGKENTAIDPGKTLLVPELIVRGSSMRKRKTVEL